MLCIIYVECNIYGVIKEIFFSSSFCIKSGYLIDSSVDKRHKVCQECMF